MSKLLLATRNIHKQQELQTILYGSGIELITLRDVAELPEIIEDGATFADNALKKAQITAQLSGYLCLADDSGLEVNCLDNRPGIYSARYAGEPANDAANNHKLLVEMSNIPGAERTARFVCVLALALPEGAHWLIQGVCQGRIGFEAKGINGFGYDPLFIPEGYEYTFAELPTYTKNQISHRAKALDQLPSILRKVIM